MINRFFFYCLSVCPGVPCPPGSVCLNGTCQCLSGSYLLNGRCVPGKNINTFLCLLSGKDWSLSSYMPSIVFSPVCLSAQVFPGQLHITSVTFQDEMFNRSSSIFHMTAANISASVGYEVRKYAG